MSTYNPVTNQISGSGLGITASLYGTSSWAKNAVTSSQGAFAWGKMTYTGSTTLCSAYNCSASRTTMGVYPITFNNSATIGNYAVITNAFTGSIPTMSFAVPVSQSTTGFTLQFYNSSSVSITDFTSASFIVFSY